LKSEQKICDDCRALYPSNKNNCPRCGSRSYALYLPTQEDIDQQCALIQSRWSESERVARMYGRTDVYEMPKVRQLSFLRNSNHERD
jgi:hypothetical protein